MEGINNDYDLLSDEYSKSHEKPDKKYSMLPTILKIMDLDKGLRVIDVGCGDGFFSKEISKKSKKVIGIDNSEQQIKKAKINSSRNISFIVGDMLEFSYPSCERVLCPFVLGYIKEKEKLIELFSKFHKSLSNDGRVIGIIDMPKSNVHDSLKWGSIKKVYSKGLKEGAKMDIELYNKSKLIMSLRAYFHKKEVIEDCLRKAGFSKIIWEKPIISSEGIKDLGNKFWGGYLENIDIAYFVAEK